MERNRFASLLLEHKVFWRFGRKREKDRDDGGFMDSDKEENGCIVALRENSLWFVGNVCSADGGTLLSIGRFITMKIGTGSIWIRGTNVVAVGINA